MLRHENEFFECNRNDSNFGWPIRQKFSLMKCEQNLNENDNGP